MGGAELEIAATHGSAGLPLEGATPPTARRPAPYGSNHIVLTLGGSYTYRH